MHYDFYRLKDDPFAETPDPDFLYLSPSHKAALHALVEGIASQQELLALYSRPGLGKTTILRVCQARLQALYQTVFVVYPRLSFHDVLALVCQTCGLEGAADDLPSIFLQLYQGRRKASSQGRRIVLFIDEAHDLPPQTLAGFTQLFALQACTGEKLFQVVLAGLPKLQQTLNLPGLRPLQERLTVRVTLAPLTSEESLGYIGHRLAKVLMTEGELFTSGALQQVVRHAGGNPRILNMLCSNMLITGSLCQQRPISTAIAREVIADTGPRNPWPSKHWRSALALGLLLSVGWWGWQSQWWQSLARGPGVEPTLTPRSESVDSRASQPVLVPSPSSLPSPGVTPPAQQTPPPERTPKATLVPADQERSIQGSEQVVTTPQTPGRQAKPPGLPAAPSASVSQGNAAVTPRSLPPGVRVTPQASVRQEAPPAPVASTPANRNLKTSERGLWRAPAPPESPLPGARDPVMSYATPDRPRVQTVHFHSSPDMATVLVDGKVVGSTPVTVRLTMGTHTVMIEKPEYTGIRYRLHIDREGESNLAHDLQRDMRGR